MVQTSRFTVQVYIYKYTARVTQLGVYSHRANTEQMQNRYTADTEQIQIKYRTNTEQSRAQQLQNRYRAEQCTYRAKRQSYMVQIQ